MSGLSITCPRCGMTSHHPVDVAERYCGNCHTFMNDSSPFRTTTIPAKRPEEYSDS